MYFQKTQVGVSRSFPACGRSNYPLLRGEKRCSTYRSHLHGCDGVRYGMLLSASDLPMLQHRPSAPHVRLSHTNRTHNGMRVFRQPFILSFLIPFIVGLDSCKPALAGLHRRCGLPMERNCRQCGRSYRGGARPQGKGAASGDVRLLGLQVWAFSPSKKIE